MSSDPYQNFHRYNCELLYETSFWQMFESVWYCLCLFHWCMLKVSWICVGDRKEDTFIKLIMLFIWFYHNVQYCTLVENTRLIMPCSNKFLPAVYKVVPTNYKIIFMHYAYKKKKALINLLELFGAQQSFLYNSKICVNSTPGKSTTNWCHTPWHVHRTDQ